MQTKLNIQELRDGFRSTGLCSGDVVMVHSSYKSLGGVEGGPKTVINALLDIIGSEGTLLLPTFNFDSWTREHYFDILETASNMGIITEFGRARSDSIRTKHPIYSFAVIGKLKNKFYECDDIEAYGKKSVFSYFHKQNGLIISIGLDYNSTFSMHHYVEFNSNVLHRRVKTFAGIYVCENRIPVLKSYTMFVRRHMKIETNIAPAMTQLFDNNTIKKVNIGNAEVKYARAQEFYDKMSKIVSEHPEKVYTDHLNK